MINYNQFEELLKYNTYGGGDHNEEGQEKSEELSLNLDEAKLELNEEDNKEEQDNEDKLELNEEPKEDKKEESSGFLGNFISGVTELFTGKQEEQRDVQKGGSMEHEYKSMKRKYIELKTKLFFNGR